MCDFCQVQIYFLRISIQSIKFKKKNVTSSVNGQVGHGAGVSSPSDKTFPFTFKSFKILNSSSVSSEVFVQDEGLAY